MNKYDLDFENIFEYLGIQSFDIDYLKKLAHVEFKKIAEALDEKLNKNLETILTSLNAQIVTIDTDVARYTERLNENNVEPSTRKLLIEKIQELTDKKAKLQFDIQKQKSNIELQKRKREELHSYINSLDDPYKILRLIANTIVYAKLTPTNARKLSKEELEKYRTIRSILRKNESLAQYVEDRKKIWENVDIANRNQSALEYKPPVISGVKKFRFNSRLSGAKISGPKVVSQKDLPMYKYSMLIGKKDGDKWSLEPRKLFEDELKGTDIQIYEFGKFAYEYFPKPNGTYLYSDDFNSLIGVIRRDEEGNLQTYHGVIYISSYAPNFYIDIPFSNIMMRNAQKNNFGFIGFVNKNNNPKGEYKYAIDFKGDGYGEIVTALSFAMNHDGKCNIARRNLSEIYEYIDQVLKHKVRAIKLDEKAKSSASSAGRVPGEDN